MPLLKPSAEDRYDDLILNTPHLTGYWPLREFAGTAARNLNPKSGAGTYTGTYTLGKPGPSADSSVDCLGSGYVSIANDTDLHTTGALSCEVWARWTSRSAWDPLMSIASYTAQTGWWLMDDGANLLFGSPAAQGTAYAWTPTNGRWYHCAATYDGTNGRVYVDGILRAGPTAVTLTGNTAAMYLGARLANDGTAGPADVLTGRLSRAAYYNGRALTAGEVQAHYVAGLA